METNKSVKACAGCPLCKFTRVSKKATVFYKIARMIQGICPDCRAANKQLNKNFQKSPVLSK